MEIMGGGVGDWETGKRGSSHHVFRLSSFVTEEVLIASLSVVMLLLNLDARTIAAQEILVMSREGGRDMAFGTVGGDFGG